MQGPSAPLLPWHRGDGAQKCPASCQPLSSSSRAPQDTAQPCSAVISHSCCHRDGPPSEPRLPPPTCRCGAAPEAERCRAVPGFPPAPHRARDAGGNRLRAGKEVEAERTSVQSTPHPCAPPGDSSPGGFPNPPRAHPRGCPTIPAGHQGSQHRMDTRARLTGLCWDGSPSFGCGRGFGRGWDWRAPGPQAGTAGTAEPHGAVCPLATPSLEPPSTFSSPGQGWAICATAGLGAGAGVPCRTELRVRGEPGPGQDRSQPRVTAHTPPGPTAVLLPSEVKPKPQRGQNPQTVTRGGAPASVTPDWSWSRRQHGYSFWPNASHPAIQNWEQGGGLGISHGTEKDGRTEVPLQTRRLHFPGVATQAKEL